MRHQMLRSLPRLRSLFYECLRVHGPAPFLLFENTEDIMLAGQTFTPDPSRVFILLTGYIGQAQSPRILNLSLTLTLTLSSALSTTPMPQRGCPPAQASCIQPSFLP
jgi:hypothetical protein